MHSNQIWGRAYFQALGAGTALVASVMAPVCERCNKGNNSRKLPPRNKPAVPRTNRASALLATSSPDSRTAHQLWED
jgi:hypothetical protein